MVASIASYIQRKCKSVWIYFVNYIVESIVYLQGDYFPIYSCNGCTVMEPVQGMHLEQSRDDMSSLQCIHSKAVGLSFPRWEDHWNIDDLYDTDLSYKVFCNQDIKIQTFLDENRFLAAIQKDGQVGLMFTVGGKQKYPL